MPKDLGVRNTLEQRGSSKDSLYDHPNYSNFDFSTLWYDIFLRDADDQIQLVCPPLRNFLPLILDDCGRILGKSTRRNRIDNGDRNTNIFMLPEPSITQIDGNIEVKIGRETVTVKLQKSMTEVFSGKNVLRTLSKNNKLVWIRDWIQYHIKYHDVNALLFYDNASTDYCVEELAELFEGIPKLLTYVIVPWNFPYGENKIEPPHGAAFCQFGAMEHGRYRFLEKANGILNLDIDELLYAENGRNVFDALKHAPNGYMLFNGLWIENVLSDVSGLETRHCSFKYRRTPPEYCPYKWIVDPKKLTREQQLMTHWITSLSNFFTSEFVFRHFRGINNSWRYPRDKKEVYMDGKFELDQIAQVEWD